MDIDDIWDSVFKFYIINAMLACTLAIIALEGALIYDVLHQFGWI